jgi:hypothetical protein
MRRLLTVWIGVFAVLIACSDVRIVAPEPTEPEDFVELWTGGSIGTGSPPGGEQCPNIFAPEAESGTNMAAIVDCYTPPGCISYNAYAPPLIWGSWYWITDHMGTRTFTISSSNDTDTILFSAVNYATGAGTTTVQFGGSRTFTTGNAMGNIYARFYGSPYGTAVFGSICW